MGQVLRHSAGPVVAALRIDRLPAPPRPPAAPGPLSVKIRGSDATRIGTVDAEDFSLTPAAVSSAST